MSSSSDKAQSQINDYVKSLCPPKTSIEAQNHQYRFWDTQPVPKLGSTVAISGPLTNLEETPLRETPYPLPKGFVWANYDLNRLDHLHIVSDFLNKYHIEDTKNCVQQVFSPEYLRWKYSSHFQGFCVAVQTDTPHNRLVGFMGAIITKTQVYQNCLDTVEPSLLTIIPKLRGKRMTTTLIKELVRQSRHLGVTKTNGVGVFSTQNYLPKPFCTIQLYNRPLNVQKLLDSKFISPTGDVTSEGVHKAFRLPKRTENKNFVPMGLSHIGGAYTVFNECMSKYQIHPVFSKEQFIHRFLSQDKLVNSYVIVEDGEDGESSNGETSNGETSNKVTDMISYYCMGAKVTNNNEETYLDTAYLNYYTCNQETSYRLLKDMLIVARDKGIDLMYSLDHLESGSVMKELNFEEGYRTLLNYYLYNWKSPTVEPHCVALTLY